MSFQYVWVLISSSGKVSLFTTDKLAIESLKEMPRKMQIGNNKYNLIVASGDKYQLYLDKIWGSTGLV